ncbi:MAG: hypothetical protein ACOZQL_02630 [Myxococcota bacterium]
MALAGIVGGTILGAVVQPEVKSEDVIEEELRRVMPRGDAVSNVSMEPDPASLRGIPPYPGVYPRRLLRSNSKDTGPMSVSWFSVKDPASVVLDFYEKAFAADGRRPVSQRRGDMGFVAWLEEPDGGASGEGILHMISAMKQYSETIVLVSASRPDLLLNQPPVPLPEGIELPPASSPPQVIQLGEAAVVSRVFYSRSLNTTPSSVVSFFERQFQQKGFTVTESTSTAAHASLTGQRDGVTLVVAARADGQNTSVVLTYDRADRAVALPKESP